MAGQKQLLGQIQKHFDGLKTAPVGFAYAVNGKPVSIRTFAHARLMRDHFGGFLRAMCLEATLARGKAKGKPVTASVDDVVRMFREIGALDEKLVETRAANTNGYRRGKMGYNGSCYIKKGAKLLAITQDWSKRDAE